MKAMRSSKVFGQRFVKWTFIFGQYSRTIFLDDGNLIKLRSFFQIFSSASFTFNSPVQRNICFWDTAYPHLHSAAGSDIFWTTSNSQFCRSQWLRGLRLRPAAARLLWLRFRTSPEEWISVSCECCVLSVRGLGNELITRPEVSYKLWCVAVCDLKTSWMRRS
jgi:hypothetical protein